MRSYKSYSDKLSTRGVKFETSARLFIKGGQKAIIKRDKIL